MNSDINVDGVKQEIPDSISAFVNGKTVQHKDPHRIRIINPSDESVVTELLEADETLVNEAVCSASDAFAKGVWSRAAINERQSVLLRCADLIREHAAELAAMDTLCVGLPYHHATLPQVYAAAGWFQYFAGFIETLEEDLYRQLPNTRTLVTREPVGVVGLFSPWNIPVMSAALKLSAALAFGNCCILKPSEQSPCASIRLVELLHEAGLPDGVLNVVNGRGVVTGAALSNHPDVRAISFTGGGQAGSLIASQASKRLAKVTLELGGKSANIIFDDADLDQALDAALVAIFSNNGQGCLAGSRILVAKSIADKFIADFVARSKKIRIGNPFEKTTELGPLSSRSQMERVLSYVDIVKSEGGEILSGGCRASGFEQGFYVQPTVARVSDNNTRVCQEEIFGPFVTFLSFDTEEQAIAIANDTRYGLTAYLWTNDLQRALNVSDQLNSGYVLINTTMQREKNAPFGGFNDSGLDREGGKYSMNFFTEAKTTVIPLAKVHIHKLGDIS
jgi:acyl-CoA reductase-like NAD-dependent aldehyde dehydrogenase